MALRRRLRQVELFHLNCIYYETCLQLSGIDQYLIKPGTPCIDKLSLPVIHRLPLSGAWPSSSAVVYANTLILDTHAITSKGFHKGVRAAEGSPLTKDRSVRRPPSLLEVPCVLDMCMRVCPAIE